MNEWRNVFFLCLLGMMVFSTLSYVLRATKETKVEALAMFSVSVVFTFGYLVSIGVLQ